MDKCEGCPLREKNPDWCSYFGLLRDREPDCHLTPDHQRIIKAMIRGVFDCGHCGKKTGYRPDEYVMCPHGVDHQYVEVSGFCYLWQDQGGEDASD